MNLTSDDILGKVALDPNGGQLGVVIKLHITHKAIMGITIDQGFTKPDLYVGIDHIKQFGIDAVLIGTIPYERLKGRHVLSSSGKKQGEVKSVLVKEGVLLSLHVTERTGTFSHHKEEVKASEIQEIGQHIILKKRVAQ